MKKKIRVSGKLQEVDPAPGDLWSFELRPGGWVIASKTLPDGSHERIRFFHSKSRNHTSTKFVTSPPLDFRGEWVPVTRAAQSQGGGNDYVAQFPGRVRKVAVKPGDPVKAGTVLMMVEAMKMEFGIKAARDGTIARVCVEEGAQLTPGQVLLELEESHE